jgi:hypothetical protein
MTYRYEKLNNNNKNITENQTLSSRTDFYLPTFSFSSTVSVQTLL